MKIPRLLLLLLICAFSLNLSAQSIPTNEIYKSMKKVADWQINVLETTKWKWPATDWTNGALYTGMMAWAKMANDDKYIHFLKNIGDSLDWKGGPERFFADDYVVGQTWAELFMVYKDSAMIKPMISISNDIIARPHTESLLWNFDGGLHNREWAWCDALYMGPPMLAYLTTATGKMKYLDIADKLWWRSANYLYDPSEHLMFRDSRFFKQKEKNGKKVFWSRGNGWVISGITRMLDNMPANYPSRKKYEKMFVDMAKRIAGLQQPDGSWHASMLDPKSFPVKETSGTAFFAYALTWGINHGYLSYNEYFPVIHKAWDALQSSIHEDGKLGFVQVPGASPESVTFDDTEVYGVGAYLLAGTELFKLMYNNDPNAAKITVKNTTDINRQEEMTEVNWQRLSTLKFNDQNTTVINGQTGEEVPSQIIYDAKKLPKFIIFQSGTGIASTAYFFLKKKKPQEYASKTYGRFVPERFDDFAWENDKIAFRMYGPALQKTGEISSGIDIWVKRTHDLVINKWYKSDDYHHDHGEGLDFYGVGTTLGAGGISPFINGKFYHSKNYISYKVLANGPLRTTFQLNYAPWNAAGIKVKETKTISLDAGSFLNKIQENYTFAPAELPVATGIAIIPGTGGKEWSDTKTTGIVAYQQPAQEAGTISLGMIVPQKTTTAEVADTEKDHYNHTGHYILSTKIKKNQVLTYYQGASWDKEGSFKNFDDWKQYLQNKVVELKNPLKVIIHK